MKRIINFLYSIYHWFWALGSAIVFGFPSRKITVIGITGTKGKTTTVHLVSKILEASGKKTAFVSSNSIKIGSKVEKNRQGNSMPGRFFLQQFLKKAVLEKCDVAIIEVTSQGVVQHRHRFIYFDRAVFLNIHPEHIEAHGSFKNYLKAKVSFFSYVSKHHNSKTPKFIVPKGNDFSLDFIKAAGDFEVFTFGDDEIGDLEIPKSLLGDFNKSNIFAAITVAKTLGVSDKAIKRGIEEFEGVEGRMEVVVSFPFTAVVDYAHTPDSLEAVYKHWKSKKGGSSKMICVLGSAGGGRDKWKRPKFGEIASRYCNYVILTNEDPYDEDALEILNQIEVGLLEDKHHPPVLKILDRKEAIETAISLAKEGDIVICTGKGAEEFIHVAFGKKIPWSDKNVILEAVKNKFGKN
jgi:UDP-N-acetylmuramyl tripeptide synthase